MIFLKLFWVFLKVGTFGFGGGYAMLSFIQEEVVDNNHWITKEEFTDLVAISQMTPGPIGINSATYVGFITLENQGYSPVVSILGSFVATLALCLPSFIMICIISYYYFKFRSNKYFSYAMSAIKPLGISLIALAALSMATTENFTGIDSGILFALALVCSIRFKIHPIVILFSGAIIGLIIY